MGLLDGDIAKMVASALTSAGMTKPVVLTKVTAGIRQPGALTAGTNPTETSYPAKGLEADLTRLKITETLIDGVDAAIRIFGATLPAGIAPAAGDRVAIDGTTYTIVDRGVSRDAAAASYLCQCRR